jgi:hypothetical protein
MMNLCASINVYSQQMGTLMAMGFAMLAFTKLGKKSREEAAYISFVGLSLMCLCNIFLSEQISNIVNAFNVSSNGLPHALCISVIAAALITALLMVVGKHLKIKATPAKTLLMCFFIGVALANLVGLAINNNCSAPAKTEKNRS